MVLQRTVSMPHIRSSFLQQQQHQHQQQGFVGYPSAQLPPQHQSSVQIQPEDHSMTSLPQYAPNSRPYHTPGAEQFVPFPEHIPDLASINHYASNFQSQCPVLANTTSELDQDFDLMISSLNLASPSIRDMDFSIFSQISNNSMSPSFQSPSPSWASGSPSRETSPSLSPNLNRRQPIPSPPSSIVLPSNVTSNSSPLENSTTASTSASLPPKPRRKRVRPPAPKKPKKVRPTSFACVVPGCDKVFSRAYNLTSHMKIHSSERPFHCGICPLAFSRRHDRDRHVRLHTGEKPYSCDICDAGFMRNDALLRHQKLCGVAGSAFINQDGQIWFAS
ncbi:hypothetical protein BG011_005957 [Mortierella polycephala]|uniref:C2H2-type domain-containing protein n=1 Tax=Mortierella polycephala TaxID=41804 RepID=A0A9P6U882_9FUNG|nr:hypothetical protein BG011_005957 [Mortierella polycephala]